jgi:hypothetical protein
MQRGRRGLGSALEQVRDAFAGHHVTLATRFGTGLVPLFHRHRRAGSRPRVREAWRMASPCFGTVPLTGAAARRLVSDAESSGAFYNEILRPARSFHGVGAPCAVPGVDGAMVSAGRYVYDAPVPPLQTLLPHLAMALGAVADERANTGAGAGRPMDRFAVAALVMTRRRRV